ncbi:Armadillo-type fold [Pseudocohnilembus persalinus]|uniref:Armadillo-type fold n=1 Tax=Pseudocohnilembus persalinus TaxID=266149 RepID=A0A0V0QJL0_PSEPJ|nr:Armadillo-type fold [Pseudocohnilembus persalinus]|eukprot:KRX02531.1 Armadillo-type fold [Pseudocohnilembus persalinus]
MLEKWVIPVLDAWVLVFKQIIEKPIFKEIEEEVEDFILQLSDGNCGLASKYVSARMIGFFINVKKFEISSFINERFRSILSEQDEEIKKIMLSEVIENIFQYMYDPEYNIKCLAIELVLKCPQLYSEDSREETLAQQMIGLTNLNDPQLNKFLSKNYGRIYQEFECFFQKSPEKRDQFLELYKSFSESNDEEIRENYLYNFPGFLKLIGNEFFNENKQIYLNLLLDDSSKNVNLKALQTFGEICNLLGLEKAQQQLGQTYIKLLDYYLNYDEYLESQESPEIIKQNLEQLVILMRYSKDTLFSLINKYLHYDEVQQVNDLDNYSTENQSQKQNKIKNTTSGQRNAKTRLFIIKRKSNKYSSSINLNPPIITSQNSQIFQSGNTNNSQIKVVKRTSFQIISDKQNNKNQSQEASITQQTEDENSKQQQQTNGNNKDSFSDITTTADINMNKSKSSSPGIQYNKELNSNILEKYIIFFKIIQDNLSLFNWRDVTLFIENFTCSSFFDSQVIMDQIIPIFQKIIEVSCQQIQQVAIKCFSNLINLNVYQKQALQELKLYFQKLRFNKNYQMRCLSLNLFLETSQFYPSKMLFKELKMISVLDMCDDSVFKVVYHLTKNIDKIRDLLDQDIDCQNEILEELKDTLQALVQDENTLIKENAIKQDQIIQQKESNIYQYNKKIVDYKKKITQIQIIWNLKT